MTGPADTALRGLADDRPGAVTAVPAADRRKAKLRGKTHLAGGENASRHKCCAARFRRKQTFSRRL
jgi:hypothetical protein